MIGVKEALLAAAAIQQVAIAGAVRDSVDLEPVAFARVSVEVPGAAAREAAADRFGAFVIAGVDSGAGAVIAVEAYGYAPWRREVAALPEGRLTVLLQRQPVALQEVAVEVRRPADPLSSPAGTFVVDRELVRLQPVVLETDVLRAAALSPSASPASDWVAVPTVRGGASEGTPVFLDGVRIFNPFHVGGFMSALNAEAVSRVTLLTGSSSEARAVGSVSGAMDIATRDGSRDGFRSSGSVGIASVRFSAEGPAGGSASYLVDGRRSYIDLLSRGLGAFTGFPRVPYWFGDVHGKFTADLGGVRRLSVTGYWSDEFLDSRPGDAHHAGLGSGRSSRALWSNAAVAVHYRDRIGSATVVDVSAGHSRFSGKYVVFDGRPARDADADTSSVVRGRMREYRAEVRLRRPFGALSVDAGMQATRFEADHSAIGDEMDGSDPYGLYLPFDLSPTSTQLAVHVGAEAELPGGAAVGAGLRADHFPGVAGALSPFAEVSYGRDKWKAWLSASRSHQALSSIRDEESVHSSFLGFDLLGPVEEGPLLRNTEAALGWEGSLARVSLRLEGFARRLDGLRLPAIAANPVTSFMLVEPSRREVGRGAAWGLESSWTLVPGGRGFGLVGSYRWGRLIRTVAGRTYTPRTHRNHEGELSASLRRGGSTWSVRFSARSGQPTTPIVAFLPFVSYKSPDFGMSILDGAILNFADAYNSVSLPPYVRIDVGWRGTKEVDWFGGGVLTPYASIANLFSLPNVVGVFPEVRLDGLSERVYAPQLPMLPFFGVEFSF